MKSVGNEERTLLADFVTRCFRNQADRDYVAARVLWRTGLYEVFLWPALQAVEKYLKAILLYHCEEVKSYGHNVGKALKAVQKLKRLGVDVPSDAVDFVEYLGHYGMNRYLEFSFGIEGRELLKLDGTVWNIRRYCRDYLHMPGDTERYDGFESQRRLGESRAADPARPTDFRLEGGLLEKFLDRGPREIRAALVWKNLYYGRQLRRNLRDYPMPFVFENPIHVMKPDLILPLLKTLVHLPKEVIAELESRAER